MRKIKKWRLVPLAVGLITIFGFAGQFTRSASRWASGSRASKSSNLKPLRFQEPGSAQPTPTPIINVPPPPLIPPTAPTKRDGEPAKKPARSGVIYINSGGTLTGRMYIPTQPNLVNLTAEGSVDWAHWGNGGPTVFDHKSGVTQQISNFTNIGTGQVFGFGDNPSGFSWTDGTPAASATDVHTGVFLIGVGNGFQFTIPADTNLKTVRINLGLWMARGRFEASVIISACLQTVAFGNNYVTNADPSLNEFTPEPKKGVPAAGGFPAQADIVTTYTYDAEGRVKNQVTSAGGHSALRDAYNSPRGTPEGQQRTEKTPGFDGFIKFIDVATVAGDSFRLRRK